MVRNLSISALLVIVCACIFGCTGSNDLGQFGAQPFTWQVSPTTRTVALGSSTTFTVTVSSKVRINDQVTLTVTGAPVGTTATFDTPVMPDTATTATLTVATTGSTPLGQMNLDVQAVEAGEPAGLPTTVAVHVAGSGAPDFDFTVNPSTRTIGGPGGVASYNIFATALNGFTGQVTFTVQAFAPTPAFFNVNGPTPSIVTPSTDGNSAFGITAGGFTPGAPASTSQITVTGTSGSITHTKQVDVVVAFP